MPRRTLVSWSSGKDAAWTLHVLGQDPEIELAGLLTTVRRGSRRVTMHDVRPELLAAQAEATGLPLVTIELPDPCPNEEYERLMTAAMAAARADGVEAIAFGDLFLEDVRAYRESKLEGTGIAPLFPLFGRDTRELAHEMVAAGLRAVLTSVDPRQLDRSFVGRRFDAALLDDLPDGVDPCGERGEFHTLVVAGPMLAHPLEVTVGERTERDGFAYADVRPA